jgi:hypothetical protein
MWYIDLPAGCLEVHIGDSSASSTHEMRTSPVLYQGGNSDGDVE